MCKHAISYDKQVKINAARKQRDKQTQTADSIRLTVDDIHRQDINTPRHNLSDPAYLKDHTGRRAAPLGPVGDASKDYMAAIDMARETHGKICHTNDRTRQ